MKKSFFLMGIMIVFLCSVSFAEDNPEISVYVDGKIVTWTDAFPYFDENNRTMIPLRAVSSLFGAETSWDGESNAAVVKLSNQTVSLPIGKNYGLINGVKRDFDTFTVSKNGRTYVPLAFLSQSFGFEVRYIWGRNVRKDFLDAHIIDVITPANVVLKPMVERDPSQPFLTEEEHQMYKNQHRTIRPTVLDYDIMLGYGYNNVVLHLKYMPEYEYVVVNYTLLISGWEEFLLNAIPLMIGPDGKVIANDIIKNFKSVYNENTNIYETSKFANINKTVRSGKYTYSYDTHRITWGD